MIDWDALVRGLAEAQIQAREDAVEQEWQDYFGKIPTEEQGWWTQSLPLSPTECSTWNNSPTNSTIRHPLTPCDTLGSSARKTDNEKMFHVEQFGMESNNMSVFGTVETPSIKSAVSALVEAFVAKVTEQVMEDVESKIQEMLDDYDPTEAHGFGDAVRDALSGITVTLSGELEV